MADRRKKGCPNESCILYTKKVKQSAENDFCPKCGTKLIYVCAHAKCFDEIEDLGPKHRICSSCEIEIQEKKQKVADGAKNVVGKAGKAVVAVAAPVVVGVAGKVVKDGQKGAINAGVKAVEGVVKNIIKK